MDNWTPLPKVGRRKMYGPFYFWLTNTQIGGKWALDLHFTLLLIPFYMLILPSPLGCFKYTSLRYGHLNTTSQSWKEKDVWSLLLHFLAIWALEHHFPKLEEKEVWSLLLHFLAIWVLEHHFPKVQGERSMVPSITLPSDLGTWTPLLKILRREKYCRLIYKCYRKTRI